MNIQYWEDTGEEYFPEECEYYGCNEEGGRMPSGDGWVEHCRRYRDEKDTDEATKYVRPEKLFLIAALCIFTLIALCCYISARLDPAEYGPPIPFKEYWNED